MVAGVWVAPRGERLTQVSARLCVQGLGGVGTADGKLEETQMRIIDLPGRVELPMPFHALVYPHGGSARGAVLTGMGRVVLGFDPAGAEAPDEAAVRLEDIEMTLNPARLAFDIDGDGHLECLYIPAARFGPEIINLEATRGRCNPETRAFSLNVVVELDGRALGGVIGDEVWFEIEEHGTLDLLSGRFDTRAPPFEIGRGPLKGMTFINCTGDIVPVPCQATPAFGAVVGGAGFSASGTAGQASPKILIAPKSPVRLLWQAGSARQVKVKPDIGTRMATDGQLIPDAGLHLRALDGSAIYTADTIGSECIGAQKIVEIKVCVTGDELDQTAPYSDAMNIWRAVLPAHTYDPNILIGEVMIDTHQKGAVTFLRWRLDHIAATGGGLPTGTVIAGPNHWTRLAASQMLPAEYRFTPQLEGAAYPQSDRNRTIYFRLRVALP